MDPSSLRFKKNVIPLTHHSEDILLLNPVLFNYKHDDSGRIHPGLIAEEVDKIYPELVIYDDEKKPFAIRYHELPILLLNEMKKLVIRIEELEDQLGKL